jgi:hypothetical protein
MAAKVGVALVDATALAEVTPAELPEAKSLPPPHEAKPITQVEAIKRRCIKEFIICFLN